MMKAEEYRNNGAVGALLDEYEKSIDELICAIEDVVPMELTHIVDTETEDLDCKSIQSILTHVVQSGYTYVVEIRKWLGENVTYRNKVSLLSAEDYASALKEMFWYSEDLFADYPNIAYTCKVYDFNSHLVRNRAIDCYYSSYKQAKVRLPKKVRDNRDDDNYMVPEIRSQPIDTFLSFNNKEIY